MSAAVFFGPPVGDRSGSVISEHRILISASGSEAEEAAEYSDLQQDEGVDHEEDREEDRRAVEVALDHRAAAEGAAPAADAEGAGEAGVFARVQQDQEDQHDGDDHLEESE